MEKNYDTFYSPANNEKHYLKKHENFLFDHDNESYFNENDYLIQINGKNLTKPCFKMDVGHVSKSDNLFGNVEYSPDGKNADAYYNTSPPKYLSSEIALCTQNNRNLIQNLGMLSSKDLSNLQNNMRGSKNISNNNASKREIIISNGSMNYSIGSTDYPRSINISISPRKLNFCDSSKGKNLQQNIGNSFVTPQKLIFYHNDKNMASTDCSKVNLKTAVSSTLANKGEIYANERVEFDINDLDNSDSRQVLLINSLLNQNSNINKNDSRHDNQDYDQNIDNDIIDKLMLSENPHVLNDSNLSTQNNTKTHCDTCNCKNSKCLKLYCECFRQGKMCSSNCSCQNCQNTSNYSELRDKIIKSIKSKNPNAFEPRIINKDAKRSVGSNES